MCPCNFANQMHWITELTIQTKSLVERLQVYTALPLFECNKTIQSRSLKIARALDFASLYLGQFHAISIEQANYSQ